MLVKSFIILVCFIFTWSIICIQGNQEPSAAGMITVKVNGLRSFCIHPHADTFDVVRDSRIGAIIRLQHRNSTVTITVPRGHQPLTVILPDSSFVTVNYGSQLSFPFISDSTKRGVAVSGQAYLQVHKDALRPFTVHVREMDILVLGTSFNITAWPEDPTAIVTLTEGKLKVAVNGAAAYLNPGSSAVLTHGTGSLQFADLHLPTTLLWLKGSYSFTDARLEDVCKQLERMYGVTIRIDDIALTTKRVTGVASREEPLHNVLEGLMQTDNIYSYPDTSGRIHLVVQPK